MLCCVPLHYVYYIVSIVLPYPALHCTALRQTVHDTVLQHAALRCPVLYHTVLCRTLYVTLYRTTSCYPALHYRTLVKCTRSREAIRAVAPADMRVPLLFSSRLRACLSSPWLFSSLNTLLGRFCVSVQRDRETGDRRVREAGGSPPRAHRGVCASLGKRPTASWALGQPLTLDGAWACPAARLRLPLPGSFTGGRKVALGPVSLLPPAGRGSGGGVGELPCLSLVTAVLRGCGDTDTSGRRPRLRRGPLRLDAEAEVTDALPTRRGIRGPQRFPEILLPIRTVGTRPLVVPEKHRLHTVCPQVPHLQRGRGEPRLPGGARPLLHGPDHQRPRAPAPARNHLPRPQARERAPGRRR